MSTSKSLKTGNAAAQKPGKAATYVVTQESFDVAFEAGRTVASAFQAAAQALFPLLAPLSDQTSETAIAQWNEYRRAFSLGMAAERNIDPDSGRRLFGRIVQFLGLEKPATEKARKAAAKRAADKAAAAPDADEADSPKDGAGADAADAVRMELSKMEAHIIALVRAQKFTQAAQCIADMADAE